MRYNTKVLFLAVFLLGFTAQKSFGQKAFLSFSNYMGTGKSHDQGIEMVLMTKKWNQNWGIGLEYRSMDWGNNLGLSIRKFQEIDVLQKFDFYLVPKANLGLALYQQGSKFSPGISFSPMLKWDAIGRHFFAISFGIGYQVCPGYREYGNWKQLEFPLSLYWGWN